MVKRKKMNGGQFILPNFLVVGAAKSGTTALYYQLKRHPEIFCCPVKEPCYFSGRVLRLPQPGIGDERKFYVKTYADYCKLFEGAEGKKAIGEASADTLYFYEKTIPLIKQVLGNPRIIILLRSPVDRAFSAYLHLVRDNRETLSFEESLARGMYYGQVKAFKTEFSRVLVCLYDDFKKEPQAVIKQVCQFLEVDPDFQPANTRSRYNASGIPRFRSLNNIFLMKNIVQRTLRKVGSFVLTEDGWVKFRDSLRAKLYVKAVMKPDTRAYLQQVFREDILKLQNLLARDLGGWLKTEG
jgi:hypothetical protein